MNRINLQLAGMRKPDSCIVLTHGEKFMFQGKRMIGLVEPTTGEAVVNWRGSNSKYHMHLSPLLGAEKVVLPSDVVDKIVAACTQPGTSLGGGVIMAGRAEPSMDIGTGEVNHG